MAIRTCAKCGRTYEGYTSYRGYSFCSVGCRESFFGEDAQTKALNAQAEAVEQASKREARAIERAAEIEAEAIRRKAELEAQVEREKMAAQKRAEEEQLRLLALGQLSQSAGRQLEYDDIAYCNRRKSWVIKEELFEEQKAARLCLAAAAGIPLFAIAMKEQWSVSLGHNKSTSLADWNENDGLWAFYLNEQVLFASPSFDSSQGAFSTMYNITVNQPKDLAAWKTLQAGLRKPFNAIPWGNYILSNGFIINANELLDLVPAKNLTGISADGISGKITVSYSNPEDDSHRGARQLMNTGILSSKQISKLNNLRSMSSSISIDRSRSLYIDDVEHYRIDERKWGGLYQFNWEKGMRLPSICGKCGVPAKEGMKFCGSCGSPIN